MATRLHLVAGLVLALGLSAGCKKKAPGAALLLPGEPQRLEKQLLAELRANQRRSCPRPVLRGVAKPGRADADLVAVAEAQGSLAACAAAVLRAKGTLQRELRRQRLPAGWPQRALPYARPLIAKTPAADARVLEKVVRACQRSLPGAIARAVSHRDACSPYLAGRRELGSLAGFIRLSPAATLLARRRARRQPAAAARLLLDLIRLGQDLSRGGPGWIAPMLAAASLVDVAPTLEVILAHPGLGRSDLVSLGRELDILARTEPRLALYFRGERQSSELDLGLRLIKGRGWSLPGEARRKRHPQPKKAARKRRRRRSVKRLVAIPYSGSKRVDQVLAWIAFRRAIGPLEAACAGAGTPHGCGLAVLAHSAQQKRKALAARDLEPTDPAGTRERILGILASIGSPAHGRYVRRAARRAFLVAAMRLHVAVRLRALRTGKLPSGAEIMRLPEARREPFAGKPFRVTASPAGVVLGSFEKIDARKPFTYLIRSGPVPGGKRQHDQGP